MNFIANFGKTGNPRVALPLCPCLSLSGLAGPACRGSGAGTRFSRSELPHVGKCKQISAMMTEPNDKQAEGHDRREEGQFFENSLAFNLRRGFNRMVDNIDAALSDCDLSSHQFGVLTTIYFGRASTPSEVARLRFQNGAAITYTLDRLEQRGLLRRSRSTADKRVITLVLTEEGRKVTRQCMDKALAAQDRMAAELRPDEQAILLSLLRRICED